MSIPNRDVQKTTTTLKHQNYNFETSELLAIDHNVENYMTVYEQSMPTVSPKPPPLIAS
jgi:hypothetical protein